MPLELPIAMSPTATFLGWVPFQNKEELEVTKPMHQGNGVQGAQSVAPGAPGGQGDAPQSSPFSLFLPLILMFAVLYFVILRPERRRQKEAAVLRNSLKKGDRVLLTSGMYGTIAALNDDWIVVEIADKVRVQFQRSAVAQRVEAKEKSESQVPVKS